MYVLKRGAMALLNLLVIVLIVTIGAVAGILAMLDYGQSFAREALSNKAQKLWKSSLSNRL